MEGHINKGFGAGFVIIFLIGSLGYGALELLFRGYTHWTMMLTGGACLLTLYYLERPFHETPILIKAAGGALIITLYEFSVGLIVNLWYGWNVWNYSLLPGNLPAVYSALVPALPDPCLCFQRPEKSLRKSGAFQHLSPESTIDSGFLLLLLYNCLPSFLN